PKAFMPQASLNSNLRAIDVTLVTEPGPPCERGMTEQVVVVVIQESTGAIGLGIFTTACGVEKVAPVVTVHAIQGRANFSAGTAVAMAFREARENGKLAESSHWSPEVTLIAEDN